jgi:probable rRNA maturation factor
MLTLAVRNESSLKQLYRRDALSRLAERIYGGEVGATEDSVEASLLFCDDPFIAELNEQYLKKKGPTDVLSFPMDEESFGGVVPLGDIVISLETVARQCSDERDAMRDEIRLLFCHGMLHLLGYDHVSVAEEKRMQEKQAHYLGVAMKAAWRRVPGENLGLPKTDVRGGARDVVGR